MPVCRCRTIVWSSSLAPLWLLGPLLDQATNFFQLLLRDALVLQQVRHQLRGRTAEDALDEIMRRAPAHVFLGDAGKEDKRALGRVVPDGPLSFELSKQRLHGAVGDRLVLVEEFGDFASAGPAAIPEHTHYPQLNLAHANAGHTGSSRRFKDGSPCVDYRNRSTMVDDDLSMILGHFLSLPLEAWIKGDRPYLVCLLHYRPDSGKLSSQLRILHDPLGRARMWLPNRRIDASLTGPARNGFPSRSHFERASWDEVPTAGIDETVDRPEHHDSSPERWRVPGL